METETPPPDPSSTLDLTAQLETLPSPPFVAMEIIRLTRDQESSTADLAAVLGQDPVLTARLLQIANSPAYGLSREVTSIERATTLLGLKAVKMMALSFSLASDLAADAGALELDQYWYHSLLSAVASRRWAELSAPGLTEEAFLAGLLSHLGRLIVAQNNVDAYRPVVEQSSGGWPTTEAEVAMLGFSTGQVTAQVLEAWELPRLITAAVGLMHGKSMDDEVRGATDLHQVLQAAHVTEAALAAGAGPEQVARLHELTADVGIGDDEVDPFVVDLEERLRDLAETLDVEIPADTSHQKMLEEARMRLVSVSLSAAADLQVVEHAAEQLRVANEELDTKAHTDRLTGVPNRAVFDDHLDRTIAGIVRKGEGSIGLLMFDIDHFKAFNDTYGHQLGDDVLRHVAATMRDASRANELFARYGGEEFALIITDCQPGGALVAGERLRAAVEQLRVPSDAGDLSVTVSGGAAFMAMVGDRDAGDRLTKLADEALYRAKDTGRNRICGPVELDDADEGAGTA